MKAAKLHQRAQHARSQGDAGEALAALLELDDRYKPDPAVLREIAVLMQEIGLPDRGVAYVERALELGDTPDVRRVKEQLEDDLESWHRTQARLDYVNNRLKLASRHAIAAANVTSPSLWTIRTLVDIAVKAGHPGIARDHLERARRLAPDDPALEEQVKRLDG